MQSGALSEDLKAAERDELVKRHGYNAFDYHEGTSINSSFRRKPESREKKIDVIQSVLDTGFRRYDGNLNF